MNQCRRPRIISSTQLVVSAILALTALIALAIGQPVHHGPFGTAQARAAAAPLSMHVQAPHQTNPAASTTYGTVVGEGSSAIKHSATKPSATTRHTVTQHLTFALADECGACVKELVASLMGCVIALLLVLFALTGPRRFRILGRADQRRVMGLNHRNRAEHSTVNLIALGISRT